MGSQRQELPKWAKRLREQRRRRGLSQRQIAELLHIGQAAYNAIENSHTMPDIEKLKILAALYDCSIDYLTGYIDENIRYPSVEESELMNWERYQGSLKQSRRNLP